MRTDALKVDPTVRSIAGVEMLALQPMQLEALLEEVSYLGENYPGISALEADPIKLIWAQHKQSDRQTPRSPLTSISTEDSTENMDQSDLAGQKTENSNAQPSDAQLSDTQAIDAANGQVVKSLQRIFFKVEGVEIEVCIDASSRAYVRHNLYWKIVHNRMNPDFARNCVIGNVEGFINMRLPTVRWVGYSFSIQRICFAKDDMEVDAVLLPLIMFEDLIRYHYHDCLARGWSTEDDCAKLGKWLEQNSIASLLNQSSETASN